MTGRHIDYETHFTQCDTIFLFEDYVVWKDSGSFAPFFPRLPFIPCLVHCQSTLPCIDIYNSDVFSKPSFRGANDFGRTNIQFEVQILVDLLHDPIEQAPEVAFVAHAYRPITGILMSIFMSTLFRNCHSAHSIAGFLDARSMVRR